MEGWETYNCGPNRVMLNGVYALVPKSLLEGKGGRGEGQASEGAARASIQILTARIKTWKIVMMRGMTAMGAVIYRGCLLTLHVPCGLARSLASRAVASLGFAHGWIA